VATAGYRCRPYVAHVPARHVPPGRQGIASSSQNCSPSASAAPQGPHRAPCVEADPSPSDTDQPVAEHCVPSG
jgi:hypothetical protein